MSYVDVFTSSNIYPSELNYSAIALTGDVTLNWPEETSAESDFATRIIDVTPSAAGYAVTLPSALSASTGYTILLNNRGSYSFVVKDNAGTQVASLSSGTLWQLYLADNSTAAGTWHVLQYGATTSAATASQLAGTGLKAVGTLLSQSVPVLDFSSDYTAGATDRAKFYNWTGAGGTLTLPDPTTVGNNWFMYLRNSGTGAIVADAPGVTSIDGSGSLSFQPTESAIIASDGADFYTIGFGQSATFAFDYIAIDVAGSGDYTLSGSELNRIGYKFTGALTGDRDIIVPATVQQYWIDNSTTGSYTLTIKVAGATGVTLASGQRAIFYCDGTDVIDADSSTLSTPINVSQGGTGAITAGAALINLGGTAVGTALFTAASEASAWSTLGVAPDGVVDGGSF